MDRVRFGPGDVTRAGRRQIGPWRHQHCRYGQRKPAFAQGQHCCEHEIAASGISGKGDIARLQAAIEHPAIGRDGIIQRGRKAMFRCEAVVDGEHAAAAGKCDLRNQVAVRGHRADTKAAAMEIKNGLILRRIGWRYPFAIDATGRDAFARHRCGAASKRRIPIAAHLGHRGLAVPVAVDRADTRDRKIDWSRCDILACARHISRPIPCRPTRQSSRR